MRKTVLTSLLLMALHGAAQNPVIRNQFTADPTARVFNNKVYLYPSHDINEPDPAPEGMRKDWFCMANYHVFSSENLTDWTDHGIIITQNEVPCVQPDSYSMWAPDCVYKDGKYYFYFPSTPKGGRGFAIGVATADNPEGPFTCEPEPIKGVSGIDPCVLVDDDGQAYIYWSGMGIRGAKLKSNMKEIDGEMQEIALPQRPGNNAPASSMKVAGRNMEGLPDGFKEGPFAFKRGDWYYLTFPWVRGDTSNGQNPTETLAYSMSKSPLGPWEFKGIIMAEHANKCWTNHHSLVEYKGQWYLFYHDCVPSNDITHLRSLKVQRLFYNEDGTIQKVNNE
jgi:beta-xylosidase